MKDAIIERMVQALRDHTPWGLRIFPLEKKRDLFCPDCGQWLDPVWTSLCSDKHCSRCKGYRAECECGFTATSDRTMVQDQLDANAKQKES